MMTRSDPSFATPRWDAILFDLDGTLADSAPDLGGAGNDLRARQGLPPLPLATFRPYTGTGARGLLQASLGITPDHVEFDRLRTEFLEIYEYRMTRDTVVFPAMAKVLDRLDAAGMPWGIVTNKAERFALPLTEALGLRARARVLICGDTTARAKPHPDPLLEAARRMNIEPQRCVYVGDDLRDVQAGHAAGMATAAAAWGYLGLGDSIEQWRADHLLAQPEDLAVLAGVA